MIHYIKIPEKDFIKEHKNLLYVLKNGSRDLLDKEFEEQQKELQDYLNKKEKSKNKKTKK